MKRVSVAELKAKLSEYLAAAKRGEDVIVTDRGRPVAKLTGLADLSEFDAHIAELVRMGYARPPLKQLDVEAFLAMPRGNDPEGAVLEELLKDREESW